MQRAAKEVFVSRVSQKGDMGVLQRLSCTYKYLFAHRHNWDPLAEVQTAYPTSTDGITVSDATQLWATTPHGLYGLKQYLGSLQGVLKAQGFLVDVSYSSKTTAPKPEGATEL